MKIELTVKKEFDIKKVSVRANVRYWKDCKVNGIDYNEEHNPDFTKIPCKENDMWNLTICIESGIVLNWVANVKLKTWFKVCDGCEFGLIDSEDNEIYNYSGYVPKFLSLDDSGYGDYIYLTIDEYGKILNWNKDLIIEFMEEIESEK